MILDSYSHTYFPFRESLSSTDLVDWTVQSVLYRLHWKCVLILPKVCSLPSSSSSSYLSSPLLAAPSSQLESPEECVCV